MFLHLSDNSTLSSVSSLWKCHFKRLCYIRGTITNNVHYFAAQTKHLNNCIVVRYFTILSDVCQPTNSLQASNPLFKCQSLIK